MNFQEMIDQATKSKPRPIVGAQVLELRDLLRRYCRPCPHAVGDLVQGRSNAYFKLKGPECPYIVLEVVDRPEANFACDVIGMRFDVRVAWIDDEGDVVVMWTESWCFEKFRGEV